MISSSSGASHRRHIEPRLTAGWSAALLALLLVASSSGAQEKRVLVIGIDGLLADAIGSASTPVINGLFADGGGFLAYGYTEDLTFSGPSWSSILNGVHRDRHGVETNQYDGHDFSRYPSFLERAKDANRRIGTAAFVTWPLLRNNFTGRAGTPVAVDHLVYRDRREEGDVQVLEEAVALLAGDDPGVIFFYQNDVDAAGHAHGFSMEVAAYREQVRVTDARIGRLLQAMRNRPGVQQGREEWLVVVVTDHGGVGTHHTGNLYRQRLVPLVLSGPSVRCSELRVAARVVDVSRTVLTYLGVPSERQADLDGRDLLAAACETRGSEAAYGRNLVFNGDGELDRGFADRGFDQAISGWRDQEHTGDLDGHHSMTLLRAGEDVRYVAPATDAPVRRGLNVFAGGSRGWSSKMTQVLDVGSLSDNLASGRARYRISGYLGARPGSGDRMVFTAYFRDAAGEVVGTAIVEDDATEAEGPGSVLTYREASGGVPARTASIVFELHAIGTGDGVEAYADLLSFELLPLEARE